jgi:hypothetical protein
MSFSDFVTRHFEPDPKLLPSPLDRKILTSKVKYLTFLLISQLFLAQAYLLFVKIDWNIYFTNMGIALLELFTTLIFCKRFPSQFKYVFYLRMTIIQPFVHYYLENGFFTNWVSFLLYPIVVLFLNERKTDFIVVAFFQTILLKFFHQKDLMKAIINLGPELYAERFCTLSIVLMLLVTFTLYGITDIFTQYHNMNVRIESEKM